MFEAFADALTEAFETLAEALKDLLETMTDTMELFGYGERQVFEFSTDGYGEAAGLPERKSSSIVEFHSAPISSS